VPSQQINAFTQQLRLTERGELALRRALKADAERKGVEQLVTLESLQEQRRANDRAFREQRAVETSDAVREARNAEDVSHRALQSMLNDLRHYGLQPQYTGFEAALANITRERAMWLSLYVTRVSTEEQVRRAFAAQDGAQ
jgi:hypothetical protein